MKLITLFSVLMSLVPVSGFCSALPFYEMMISWNHLPAHNTLYRDLGGRAPTRALRGTQNYEAVTWRVSSAGTRVYSESEMAGVGRIFVAADDAVRVKVKAPMTAVYVYTAPDGSFPRRRAFEPGRKDIRHTLRVAFYDGQYVARFQPNDFLSPSASYFYVTTNPDGREGPDAIQFSVIR